MALQESLRRELRRRVEAGELTGLELARRAGFTQAHISNFLNRKRGLKLAALDRMLKATGLSVYDLLNPRELEKFAAVPAGDDEDYAEVPLVDACRAASSEVIVNAEVREMVKLRRAMLKRIQPELAAAGAGTGGLPRSEWTRFVLIRLEQKEGPSMWPRLGPGSILLIDRHYTSLRPYRKGERNLYAVRTPEGCAVRYVELSGNLLIMLPHNPEYPTEVLPLEPGHTAADLIAGRVAHVSLET